MRWRWAALVGAALAVGVLVAVVAVGSAGKADTRVWRELPAPPLSPREYPTGFWTGSEVVLVGGSDAPPCPPNASCEVPRIPPLADGAAYDPASDSWRPIADAPVAFSWATPIVIDSTAYLWIPGERGRPGAPGAFLAYRADADRWEELFLPTDLPDGYSVLAAGDQLVAYVYDDANDQVQDLVYEPAADVWTNLPADPLPASDGRVMVWNGAELLLFGGWEDEEPQRGAALDLDRGEWRVLDDPGAEYGLAFPERDESLAGIIDESGARYFAKQGDVRDEVADETLRMPELEAIAEAYGGTTDVTAGTALLVFQGTDWSDPEGRLHSRSWLWSPRR